MLARRKKLAAMRPLTKARRARVAVEELEPRNLLSIFTPAQIRHAYGFDQVMFGSMKGDGTGQTIAIVDAFDDPNIANDLRTFDARFGLPVANLTKATPQGKPRTNAGWALEISLDVEWAHAIAPGAKILLVEARDNSFTNLLNAVDYARKQTGVVAVSMSWGANDVLLGTAFETGNDGFFTTTSGHTGVTFVASSGDDGGGPNGPQWPAISPNVIAVGGTSLFLDGQGNYSSESAWAGSTGGLSSNETEPTYQMGVQSTGFRSSPDVSMVGDPNTGVYVYTTISQRGHTGYFQVGGTSAGAPMWAALVAIADQGRAQIGVTSGTRAALDGANDTLPALYNLSSSDFNDVTTGANNVASATVGYDQVTGRGTPKAALVIRDLLKVVSVVPSPSGTVGSGGGGARRVPPHVVPGPGPTTAGTTSAAADAALATALIRASVFTTPSVAATVPAQAVNTSPSAVPVSVPSPAPVSIIAGPSFLVLGDNAAGDDVNGVPVDDGQPSIPPPPVIPAAPAGMDLPAVPDRSIIDQLYDDEATEGRCTSAFAVADASMVGDQSDAETSVAEVSVAVAVAMGGFWMNLAERPARRKRPELAI